MEDSDNKAAYKQGIISIIVNLVLFISKYYVGIISGSVALITDAWHTFSDSASSVVLIIGTKLSSKPADKEHPYGHGRIELITALVIGIMLTLIGFNFLSNAIKKLIDGEAAVFGTLAISVTLASIILNELLAQYAFYIGRRTANASIKADGWHHRSDSLSSLIILVGILVGKYWWWLDGVLGIIMAGFIFYAGYGIFKEVINPLIGVRPDSNVTNEISTLCSKIAGKNVYPHHFHSHQYGRHTELTFHIALDGGQSLTESHKIVDEIEQAVGEKFNYEVTIHFEPLEDLHTKIDIAREVSE
jgi:cation diffusion facilitator family transporter